MSMTIIAFDVGKHELVGARMRKNGTVAERYTIENTPDAINEFLDLLEKKTKRIIVGSEATAEYHLNLARCCIARTIPFKLFNPIITKQFTRATIRKRKTDTDDAEIIGAAFCRVLDASSPNAISHRRRASCARLLTARRWHDRCV